MSGHGLSFCVLVAGLLLWLALSDNPTDRRRDAINREIRAGRLGRLPAAAEARLREQVGWLARHSGIGNAVAVNAPLERGRLSVIVSTARLNKLTGCGKGNAIYDPSLDTIFLDESLILPYELAVLGEPGAHSMVDVNTLGFVVSYVNFILAHEMGHRQKNHKAAAFFHYGWNDGSPGVNEHDERDADRFAVVTIMKAYEAGDVPQIVRKLNALERVGLTHTGLSASDQAAGDVMGAMVTMSIAMLFSSSPYSPYFFDASHPDFIRRAEDAIRGAAVPMAGKALEAHNPVVRAQLERFRGLGRWSHCEVFFPAPVYEVDVRGGDLWVGCYDLPTPSATSPPQERLFRVPLAALKPVHGAARPPPVQFLEIASGTAPTKSLPGSWIKQLFEVGRLELGLPPAASDQPRAERDFAKSAQHSGFEYAGISWVWRDGERGEVQVREATLEAGARRLFGGTEVKLGLPQRTNTGLAVPVSVSSPSGSARSFALLSVRGPNDADVVVDSSFALTHAVGEIAIEGARFARSAWWVPVRVKNEHEDKWLVYRVPPAPDRPVLRTGAPLLAGFVGPGGAGEFRRDLDPLSVHMFVVEGGPLLIGFDQDSLYAIDPDDDGAACNVTFHPMVSMLKVLNLGGGRILIWVRNGQKAFVVDVNSRK